MMDKRIEKIRALSKKLNETMVVGAGGFTSAANPQGPVAGFDPVMGKVQKRYAKGGTKSRKKWLDYLKNK